jgi:hypothetical protein
MLADSGAARIVAPRAGTRRVFVQIDRRSVHGSPWRCTALTGAFAMQARELHCTDRPAESLGWLPLAACLGIALFIAPARPGATPVVDASMQTSRDDERVRILRHELARTEALTAQLAQREAERLSAGDAVGAKEAEAQRVRAMRDIDALEREIAAATERSPRTSKDTAARGRAAPGSPRPAWWDVYGRSPRGGAAASLVSDDSKE